MSDPASILIVKPSSLGDVVHTLPSLHFLKQQWPQSRVFWVINPEWMPLLEGNPDIEDLIAFPRREFRGIKGWLNFWSWSDRLSASSPELCLDFQGLFRSGLMSRRSGAKRILGLSDAREGARFLYHQTADVKGIAHSVDRYLELTRLAGASTEGAAVFSLPQGSVPKVDLPTVPFVVVHPYSRGSGKALTEAEMLELLECLSPLPVVLIGQGVPPANLPSHVLDFSGKTTLGELIYLLRRSAFTISVDSGPMHIAAGLGSNLLSIHTWSDPDKVGPYPLSCWIWKAGQLCIRKEYAPVPGPERPLKSDFIKMAGVARRFI